MAVITPVTLTLGTDAPVITPAGFRTMLVVAPQNSLDPANFTDRIRYYTTTAEIDADTDLDDAPTIAAAKAALAQSRRVQRVAVGRWDTGDTNIGAALTAISAANDDWYGFVLPPGLSAVIYGQAATHAVANEKLMLCQDDTATNLTAVANSVIDTLRDGSYGSAAYLYHTDAEYAAAAWMSKLLSVNQDQQTSIAAYLNLQGITKSSLTATELTTVLGANGNVYGSVFGQARTWRGRTANGRPIDERISIDWFKSRAREGLGQLFANAAERGTKIPYTAAGLQQVRSALLAVLRLGEGFGHFTPGKSYVNVIPIDEVPQADKDGRIARLTFGAEFQGAIEEVDAVGAIVGTLNL